MSSNKFGSHSSELEESNTGRCTDAVRGITTGTDTLGRGGGGAGIARAAAATGSANGPPIVTFIVPLPGLLSLVLLSLLILPVP